ncbi:hypothetical protein KCU95_g110, partial [Aureobasidium melanogenum]
LLTTEYQGSLHISCRKNGAPMLYLDDTFWSSCVEIDHSKLYHSDISHGDLPLPSGDKYKQAREQRRCCDGQKAYDCFRIPQGINVPAQNHDIRKSLSKPTDAPFWYNAVTHTAVGRRRAQRGLFSQQFGVITILDLQALLDSRQGLATKSDCVNVVFGRELVAWRIVTCLGVVLNVRVGNTLRSLRLTVRRTREFSLSRWKRIAIVDLEYLNLCECFDLETLTLRQRRSQGNISCTYLIATMPTVLPAWIDMW